MRDRGLLFIGLIAIVAIAVFLFYPRHPREAEHLPPPPPTATPEPAPAIEEPAILHPVTGPQPEPLKPLPGLDASDAPVRDEFSALFGADAVGKLLAPEDLIRRIVSTVDNLPREKLALRLWPLLPTSGKFAVVEQGGKTLIAPENDARYKVLVAAVAALDLQAAASFYQRYYPLFQKAYRDLGYPSGYFNDRLVEVIDHLLATPEPAGPLELVRPAVYYKYLDPKLEALSAGQKTLLRMGVANARVIKGRLSGFRNLIAGGQ